MPAHEPASVPKLPLSVRIDQAEHDIDIRRHLIRQRAIELKEGMFQRLVSPAALATYAGLGLVAGLLLGRQHRVSGRTDTPQNLPTGAGRIERFFSNAFKVIAMVRTLAALLPESHPAPTSAVTPRNPRNQPI